MRDGMPATKDILRMIRSRLPPEAWDVLDAFIVDVTKAVARVRRKRDGKEFVAELQLLGGHLELKPR